MKKKVFGVVYVFLMLFILGVCSIEDVVINNLDLKVFVFIIVKLLMKKEFSEVGILGLISFLKKDFYIVYMIFILCGMDYLLNI